MPVPAPQAGAAPSVYVLKMGQPVKIAELAERLIRLSGLEPERDIEIRFTGVRPGERLHEILFDKDEPMVETGLRGVMAAQTPRRQPADHRRMARRAARRGGARRRRAGERRAHDGDRGLPAGRRLRQPRASSALISFRASAARSGRDSA